MPAERRASGRLRAARFVLRTPVLAIDTLAGLSERLEVPKLAGSAAEDELRGAAERDRRLVGGRLRELVAGDTVLAEAIAIASPSLSAALDEDPDDARRRGKQARGLWSYVGRAATRTTPFGLFVGWDVGRFGDATHLALAPRPAWQRSSQIDAGLLDTVSRSAEPGWDERTRLRVTPSCYRLRDRIRYLRDATGTAGRIVAIPARPDVLAAIEAARHGASAGEIATRVQAVTDDPERARRLIAELVQRELLVPEGRLAATGEDACREVAAGLRSRPRGGETADRLDRATGLLRAIDRDGPGQPSARYAEVERLLDLGGDGARVVVDLRKRSPGLSINRRVTAELERAATLVARLQSGHDRLAPFRRAFAARYDQRWVRLVEALDPETGVEFAVAEEPASARAKRDMRLLELLHDVAPGGELELTESQIDALAEPDPLPLPDAFSLHVTLAATDAEAIDRGEFEVILNTGAGPSGARLLGRFAAVAPEVAEVVDEHLRAEEALDPEAVHVELASLAGACLPRVVRRPVLRGYELELGGASGAPADRRLELGDVWIRLDEHERFRLRSERLDREVVVRATTAFNFWQPGPPVLQLLCALQADGTALRMFDWGALAGAPWLPRLRSGRVVLSRASWRLRPGWERGDDGARIRSLRAWRERFAVPRWVGLREGEDMRLPLDLESAVCIDVLAARARAGQYVLLEEVDPAPARQPVPGEGGRFAHELIVPLVQPDRAQDRPRVSAARAAAPRVPTAERAFPPGSEWLTAKLYMNPRAGDAVLRDLVAPLVDEVQRAGVADSAHFLRTGDPDFHVRLRLHGAPEALLGRALAALSRAAAAAIDDGRLARLQLDTYEREIERYGGLAAVRLSERLWHADSTAVLTGLEHVRRDDQRWLLAAVGVDLLLRDAGLSATDRLGIVRALRANLAGRLGIDDPPGPAIRARTRERLDGLRRAIAEAQSPSPSSSALSALQRRTETTAGVYRELNDLRDRGELGTTWLRLVGSHVHLHVLRVLSRPTSRRELSLYDALERHYSAVVARARAGTPA